MRKRRLCMACLPILIWFVLAGLAGRGGEDPPRTWRDGEMLEVSGVVRQIITNENSQKLYLKHISILSETQNSNIIVYMKEAAELHIGETIRVKGLCAYPEKAKNPGGFDAAAYYAQQNIFIYLKKAVLTDQNHKADPIGDACHRLKVYVKSILTETAREDEAGVLESLLLGDRTGLESEIRDLYQQNGIIHVLAISGLHISMIGMAVFQFFRKCRWPFLPSAVCAMSMVLFYGFLTGFAVSATRAVLMFLIYLGAQVLGRTVDLPTSMMLSAVLMLCAHPGRIMDCGFLLSYAAVLGVWAAGQLHRGNGVGSSLLVSLCTWLTTLPVTAYFYYQVPVYGILLNLFVIPSMSAVLLFGLLSAMAGMLWIPAGQFLTGPVHLLLQCTFALCRGIRRLPGAVLIVGRPGIWQITSYYVILVLLFLFFRKTSKIGLIKQVFGIILGIEILFFRGPRDWALTFLDVGQGDGICVETTDGTAWMIDGGSSSEYKIGQYCLEAYLKYRGISCIDGWMISHYDDDHVSGLLEILERYERGIAGNNIAGITIRQLILPDTASDSETGEQILQLADKNRIPVRRCVRGDTLRQGDMTIRVLGPVRDAKYEDENAASMVLEVSYREFAALLTGDVQGSGEEQLSSERLDEIDVLKVAHHGSKNSTSEEFLAQLQGCTAVISCGRDNRYGHPHEELLQRLETAGCRILRTDEDGMIRFAVK